MWRFLGDEPEEVDGLENLGSDGFGVENGVFESDAVKHGADEHVGQEMVMVQLVLRRLEQVGVFLNPLDRGRQSAQLIVVLGSGGPGRSGEDELGS